MHYPAVCVRVWILEIFVLIDGPTVLDFDVDKATKKVHSIKPWMPCCHLNG